MNIKRYDVSGRYDGDGDEIPPIIKICDTGRFVEHRSIKHLIDNEVVLNRIILSERNIPLVYQFSEDISEPVLTVENYTKWYNLYLVTHDRSVNIVEFDVLQEFVPRNASPYRDHVPNPIAVKGYADKHNYHLDEQSLEVMVGRWALDCTEAEVPVPARHRFDESICPRCSECGGKLYEVVNEKVSERDDSLAPSMKGKKYLFYRRKV
jgi:hypothetical protein